MSKNKLISCCWITRNASDFLWESIRSVYDYCDEILIIDDNSTDGTIDIIKSFSEKKITLIQGNYGQGKDKRIQRSEYLKRAKGQWLHILDDDEVYSSENLNWLHKVIQSAKFQNINEIFFRILWFWHDGQHVIHGHHWDQRFETFYRNLPGLKYEVHHYVSYKGQPLCKKGPSHITDKVTIFHYSHCKPDEKIRAKLRYYMLRDNPNVTKANVEKYVNMHPHFSNKFNFPRYGPGGLQVAGTVGSQRDKIEEYTGQHPSVMKGHPLVMKKGPQSMEEYKKRINSYMETCWQFHNHLSHFRHTERIKYTAEFLKGRSVEVGCAMGISTDIMYKHLKSLGKTDVIIEGVEPTDLGFSSAVKTYPHIKFTKAMGENLPFKDGEFTTVLMAEVLEHVQSPEIFLRECVRVCKERLIASVPCGNHPDPDHQRTFDPVTLSKLLSPHLAYAPRIYGLDANGYRVTDHRKLYFLIAVGEKAK